MALVINIANKLQKKYEANSTDNSDQGVYEYLDSVGEEWRAFCDDELKKSNENNSKTLGGCTSRKDEEEDENNDSSYDVQMEKIMARFTNFNQILSQNSGNDDDDDEEEEDNNDDSNNYDEDDEDGRKSETTANSSDSGLKIEKVELKEPQILQQEFIDNTFWSLPP